MHEKMYAQLTQNLSNSDGGSTGSVTSIWHHLFSLDAGDEDDEPTSPGQTPDVDEGDRVELTVTIPANVRPGQIIAMKTDGGRVVHVPVPEDAVEGQTVKFMVAREQLGDEYKDDDDKALETVRDESVLALAQLPNRKKVGFVVLPRNKKLGLRRGPAFDAERTNENVTRGCVLPYGRSTTVLKDASDPSQIVRMYRLDDGRGWVHDFNPDASTPGVIQCTLVRVRMSPGGLAALLEEPGLPHNGGALELASMKPDSPLHQVDVRLGDLLVLVNQVPVVGYGQSELTELMASLRASEKTLTFLRPTAAGEQIDDTARDESVLGLAALASGAHVVHAITPKAIGLRSQAAFPGEDVRTGVILAPGSILPYNRSRVVPAELPTYGHVEPRMYCLSDGRGWAHDFDPERLFLTNLAPCVVVHVRLDAGLKLGVNVEEPDVEFEAGGGHVVTELNSDSPLKARGVQVGDVLVMVNHIAVSGYEPGELGALLGQLANEDKTITFIRKVADPSETPSDEHIIDGAILKLKDAREKTHVVQVVATKGIGLRQGDDPWKSARTGEVAPPDFSTTFSDEFAAAAPAAVPGLTRGPSGRLPPGFPPAVDATAPAEETPPTSTFGGGFDDGFGGSSGFGEAFGDDAPPAAPAAAPAPARSPPVRPGIARIRKEKAAKAAAVAARESERESAAAAAAEAPPAVSVESLTQSGDWFGASVAMSPVAPEAISLGVPDDGDDWWGGEGDAPVDASPPAEPAPPVMASQSSDDWWASGRGSADDDADGGDAGDTTTAGGPSPGGDDWWGDDDESAAVTSPAPSAAPSLLSPGPAVEDDDEAWWGEDEPESPVEPGLSI